MPSHDYLIISNLPKGSRLTHGYDNGDGTWTLMSDELAELKFLSGPVRGVVSLKAQIFSLDGSNRSAKAKRQIPLVLHTDDGTPWTPPDQGIGIRPPAETSSATSTRTEADTSLDKTRTGGNSAARSAIRPIDANSNTQISGSDQRHGPAAPASAVGHKSESNSALGQDVDHPARPSKIEQRWADELGRLSQELFSELRHEAKAALEAAAQRHMDEVKELSSAIMKQHEVIAKLRHELEQSKQEAAKRLSEAEQQWRHAEAERLDAARLELAREKDDFRSALNRQHSIAEQLRIELEEIKARGETQKRAFEERLKEAAAEAERSLLIARTEWQGVVARCLETAELQIKAEIEKVKRSGK